MFAHAITIPAIPHYACDSECEKWGCDYAVCFMCGKEFSATKGHTCSPERINETNQAIAITNYYMEGHW